MVTTGRTQSRSIDFPAVPDINVIVRDSRHDEVQLISFTCIESRIFDIWVMHGIDVFSFNRELSQQLRISYGEENGEVRFPTEEWEVLSLIHDIRRVND